MVETPEPGMTFQTVAKKPVDSQSHLDKLKSPEIPHNFLQEPMRQAGVWLDSKCSDGNIAARH